MGDNVAQFPPPKGPPEWMIGPFEEWRVVIEGRAIPYLTAFREGSDHTCIVVDNRFTVSFPNELAYQAAWLLANAIAVGAGFPWLGAESRDRPFAPKCSAISPTGEQTP